jgi:nucleoside-diphosphate-sugar epimerase
MTDGSRTEFRWRNSSRSQSDVVIHLAAAVGVKLIVDHPVETIEINVNGTEAVLKAALHYECRVLIASTSEVYGKGSRIPFSEDDDVLLGSTMKSRWSYAASKMVDEFLALAYYREFGLPVTICRLFNTVGPRQRGRYGMVIPRLVVQALAGEPLTVYGTGEQQRCFCDVRDVVRQRGALPGGRHHRAYRGVGNKHALANANMDRGRNGIVWPGSSGRAGAGRRREGRVLAIAAS